MASVLIPNEISMIVNSNPADGAANLSSDGSLFQVNLEDGGIQIPKDALNVNVSVETASIWFSTPNIINVDSKDGILKKNNKFYIVGPNLSNASTSFIITLDDGLYDIALLNDTVKRLLIVAGAQVTAGPLVLFSADAATGRIFTTFNYAATTIDFTQPDTFREILGYASALITPAGGYTAPKNVDATLVANFNTLNSYLIHSDIVANGIRFNNTYVQAITEVLIDVSPYEQINSTPFNPARSQANELRGIHRNNITFWLTDQDNRRINTNGEYWSLRMVIRYDTVLVLT